MIGFLLFFLWFSPQKSKQHFEEPLDWPTPKNVRADFARIRGAQAVPGFAPLAAEGPAPAAGAPALAAATPGADLGARRSSLVRFCAWGRGRPLGRGKWTKAPVNVDEIQLAPLGTYMKPDR